MLKRIALVCLWLSLVSSIPSAFGQTDQPAILTMQQGGTTEGTATNYFKINFTSGCTVTQSSGAFNIACTGGAANPGGSPNQIQYNSGGTSFNGFTLTGDCTLVVSTGAITCTKSNGSVFGSAAFISSTAGGDLSGSLPSPTVTNGSHITNASIANSGLTNPFTTVNGQTCTLGSTCTISTAPTGSAGGDLGGTYPNPSVAALKSVPFCSGFTPTNGQFVEYTTGGSPNPCYSAATASGSFTPGGDLSGTSSTQHVIGINSVPLCTGFTPTNGQVLSYTTGSSPNPCYTATTVSSSGTYAAGQPAVGNLAGTAAIPSTAVIDATAKCLPYTAGTDIGICINYLTTHNLTGTIDLRGLPNAVYINSPMVTPAGYLITAVASGTGVYTGTFPAATNALAGYTITISGFSNSANNVVGATITASTATTITTSNSASVAQSGQSGIGSIPASQLFTGTLLIGNGTYFYNTVNGMQTFGAGVNVKGGGRSTSGTSSVPYSNGSGTDFEPCSPTDTASGDYTAQCASTPYSASLTADGNNYPAAITLSGYLASAGAVGSSGSTLLAARVSGITVGCGMIANTTAFANYSAQEGSKFDDFYAHDCSAAGDIAIDIGGGTGGAQNSWYSDYQIGTLSGKSNAASAVPIRIWNGTGNSFPNLFLKGSVVNNSSAGTKPNYCIEVAGGATNVGQITFLGKHWESCTLAGVALGVATIKGTDTGETTNGVQIIGGNCGPGFGSGSSSACLRIFSNANLTGAFVTNVTAIGLAATCATGAPTNLIGDDNNIPIPCSQKDVGLYMTDGTSTGGKVLLDTSQTNPSMFLASPTLATTPSGVPELFGQTPSGGVAGSVQQFLPGIAGRSVTASTDTTLTTDCNPARVAYTGGTAVTVTLPTPTTLGVPYCSYKIAGNTSNTITITPTTWTCSFGSGGTPASSCVLQEGQNAQIFVDPTTANNWAIDRQEQGITLTSTGTGMPNAARSTSGLSLNFPATLSVSNLAGGTFPTGTYNCGTGCSIGTTGGTIAATSATTMPYGGLTAGTGPALNLSFSTGSYDKMTFSGLPPSNNVTFQRFFAGTASNGTGGYVPAAVIGGSSVTGFSGPALQISECGEQDTSEAGTGVLDVVACGAAQVLQSWEPNTSSGNYIQAVLNGLSPAGVSFGKVSGILNTHVIATATGNTTTYAALPSGAGLLSTNSNTDPEIVAGTGLGVSTTLTCADTSGSGTAQSCTTSPSFTPAANTCVIYTTTTANTGTGLTLNVNSLGAKSVAKWLGSTTLAAGDVPANKPQHACYDGTNWELSTIGNAPSSSGGANNQLSNLSGTVAVNLGLVPGTTNSIALGSSSELWSNLYSTQVTLANGSNTAPSVTFSNSATTGLYSPAAGTVCEAASSGDQACFVASNVKIPDNGNFVWSQTTSASGSGGANIGVVGTGTSEAINPATVLLLPQCKITSAVSMSVSGTAVTFCSWNLPNSAQTWAWQCSGTYSTTTSSDTFALGYTLAHPTAVTGNAQIYSTLTGTSTAGSTSSTTATTNQTMLTGASVSSVTSIPFTTSGVLQATGTAGTFVLTGTLTGTSPAGTVNVGTTCQLY